MRAIAVLAVILFHADFSGFLGGGFAGVDVFFCISGFLITGLIIEDHDAGRFSIVDFYARRSRRILPALILVAVACACAAPLLPTPADKINLFQTIAATSVFASNFFLAETTGYFDGASETKPLLHTWSLAVEEQFYLLFPALLMGTLKFGNRRSAAILGLAALASLALGEYGWRHFQGHNFFLTASRGWELLAGAIAALLQKRNTSTLNFLSPRGQQWIAALGMALILVPLAAMNRSTPAPSIHQVPPVLGTVLVLLFATSGTLVARVLATRSLVAIGLVSYSAYLWHQPILAFVRASTLGQPPWEVKLAVIAVTLLCATLSWKYVEQPFRRNRTYPPRDTLRITALASTLLLGVGIYGSLLVNIWGSTIPSSVLRAFDPPLFGKECFDQSNAHKTKEEWLCTLNSSSGARTSFALFGDSHALQLASAMDAAATHVGRKGVFTGFSGCAPLLGIYPLSRSDQGRQNCHLLNKRMLDYVVQKKIKDVILVAKWSYYTNYWNGSSYLNAIGLHPNTPISLENSRLAFAAGLKETVEAYTKRGIRLHLLEQVPQQTNAPQIIYAKVWETPSDAEELLQALSVRREDHERLQAYVNSAFATYMDKPNVEVLNLDDLFCDATFCPVGTPHQSYYKDQSHLSSDGAQRMIPSLQRILSE
ncbi:MAG: acyltransferase [Ramlibacter sp.]|nr:acyltransferase [Ramlibacter sp.]